MDKQVFPFHGSLSKMVAVLGIPEQNQAVISSIAITGLLGNSLESLDGGLSMLCTEVLKLIVCGACDGRIVECKQA